MTLNQLAASVANALNQPYNHELKERIKDLFKEQVALYIRRQIKEHGMNRQLMLDYPVPIVRVPMFNSPLGDVQIQKEVARSKYKVLTAMNITADAPYTYVGTVDGLIAFPYRNRGEHNSIYLYSPTGGSYSYFMSNGYIYINDKPNHLFKADYIKVEGVFSDPEEVISFYGEESSQDTQLPFPNDIVAIARNNVMQAAGAIRVDDQRVEHNVRPIQE